MGKLILIGGGVRSGKSDFALRRAAELGRRRVFVATAEARDAEMTARIAQHRADRGEVYRTVEAPRALAPALASISEADVVVVDCLTLWLSNLLLDGADMDGLAAAVEELIGAVQTSAFDTLIVTNEVGMGIVPDNALSRVFRDATGRAHQRLGAVAEEVYFAALGQMLRLKPAPIEAVLR